LPADGLARAAQPLHLRGDGSRAPNQKEVMSETPQFPVHPTGQQPVYVVAAKSKIIAALLAFFLGTFGIHNFYLGYTGKGVVQLILGLIGYATSWLLIGLFILIPLAFWVFIEFILLLVAKQGTYSRSADGKPLS